MVSRHVVLAGIAVVGLSSCLAFSPLDQSGQSFMNAPATDVTCLDHSASFIETYWNGVLADSSSVGNFWGCTSKAVNVFQSRVRGSVVGEYTANEVRTLATKFFIKNTTCTHRCITADNDKRETCRRLCVLLRVQCVQVQVSSQACTVEAAVTKKQPRQHLHHLHDSVRRGMHR